jgi:hypothetical protein
MPELSGPELCRKIPLAARALPTCPSSSSPGWPTKLLAVVAEKVGARRVGSASTTVSRAWPRACAPLVHRRTGARGALVKAPARAARLLLLRRRGRGGRTEAPVPSRTPSKVTSTARWSSRWSAGPPIGSLLSGRSRRSRACVAPLSLFGAGWVGGGGAAHHAPLAARRNRRRIEPSRLVSTPPARRASSDRSGRAARARCTPASTSRAERVSPAPRPRCTARCAHSRRVIGFLLVRGRQRDHPRAVRVRSREQVLPPATRCDAQVDLADGRRQGLGTCCVRVGPTTWPSWTATCPFLDGA